VRKRKVWTIKKLEFVKNKQKSSFGEIWKEKKIKTAENEEEMRDLMKKAKKREKMKKTRGKRGFFVRNEGGAKKECLFRTKIFID
jgi:nitrate reductase alpha subunit